MVEKGKKILWIIIFPSLNEMEDMKGENIKKMLRKILQYFLNYFPSGCVWFLDGTMARKNVKENNFVIIFSMYFFHERKKTKPYSYKRIG